MDSSNPEPHSHILLMEGSEVFFWSEILARKDFFGSMKDVGDFLEYSKNMGILWVLYFSSAQINNNISAIYCRCGIFLGMLKT